MNKKNIKISFIFIAIVLIILCKNVYAGRGCCSHYEGVDNTKCTTDGRQICNQLRDGDYVISDGDSCKCNPNDYNDEDLVDPYGNYETHPYDYESDNYNSNNYNNIINNSKQKEEDSTFGLKDIALIMILLFPYIIGILLFIFEIIRDLIVEIIKKQKNKTKKECTKAYEENKNYNNLNKCPNCGGQLVKRIGRYGMFIGCSNYPKCEYTRSIKVEK